MPFTIAHEDRDGRPVIALQGDLDLSSAPELTTLGLNLVDAGAPDVIIDAARLDFCDSSGLSAFVQIANRLSKTHGHLAIAAPTSVVRRVLEMSGLVQAFVVVDSIPDAIAALDETSDQPGSSDQPGEPVEHE
jgi:anti-sigma B factor antagonist